MQRATTGFESRCRRCHTYGPRNAMCDTGKTSGHRPGIQAIHLVRDGSRSPRWCARREYSEIEVASNLGSGNIEVSWQMPARGFREAKKLRLRPHPALRTGRNVRLQSIHDFLNVERLARIPPDGPAVASDQS